MEVTYNNIDFTNNQLKKTLNEAKIASKEIVSHIQKQDPKYAIFDYKSLLTELGHLEPTIEHIKNKYTDVILIGMGGSTLNPQSLIQLADKPLNSKVKTHFLDNTDPRYLKKILNQLDLNKTAIIATSNSGETLETVALTSAMIKAFQDANTPNLGKHFYFITKPDTGRLYEIAQKLGAQIIPHKANISGRFSGFTNVSTFIAAIGGVDTREYLQGLQKAINNFIDNSDNHSSTLAASAMLQSKKPILANLGYLQQFSTFLEWYCQIVAESLGKNGAGITPLRGLGPNDQHSILQLYLSGADDKFYNLFYVKNLEKKLQLNSFECHESLDHLTLSEVNDINFTATRQALIDVNRPIRTIKLEDTSAKSVGELTANMMLEVIILAKMIKINPFDQPGVELIKNNARNLI